MHPNQVLQLLLTQPTLTLFVCGHVSSNKQLILCGLTLHIVGLR